jgi:hypothetical protein
MSKRGILAIVAGVVAVIVVTTLVDILLHVAGVYPAWGVPLTDRLALLATGYRIPLSIAGAYLTARLAPEKPLYYAMILGGLGTVLGLVGVLATWNQNLGPRWYPIALAALSIPQCWIGGKLYQARRLRSVS